MIPLFDYLSLKSYLSSCCQPHLEDERSRLFVRDMKSVGCLAVELFLPQRMRVLSDDASFNHRYTLARSLCEAHISEIPRYDNNNNNNNNDKFIFRYDIHFYTRTPKIRAHSSTRTKQDVDTILWAIDENIGTNLQALYVCLTKKLKLYVNKIILFSIRAGRYVNRAGHKGIRAGRKTVRAGRSTLRNMHSWNTGCAHSLCPGDAVPVCLQVPAAGRACVAGPGGLVW